MAKNPWMSLWLSAANTWAVAARGFWTAEMQRQQKATLNEMDKAKTAACCQKLTQKRASRGAKEIQRLILERHLIWYSPQ